MIGLYCPQDSVVDKLDARVKLVFTLVFLICLNAVPAGAWPAYILFFSLVAVELIQSKLPVKKMLFRSMISLPFFLAAVPLLFTGPEPMMILPISQNHQILISQPGIIHFLSIAIKTWISVLAALLLSTTTSYDGLLLAFRGIGLPAVFVSIFSLMGRYLSLMIQEARTLMQARASRSGSVHGKRFSGGSVFWRAKVTGRMTGNLLLRSLERSERVHAAMCSRGYDGEAVSSGSRKALSNSELFFVISLSLICVLILVYSLAW